MIFVDPRGGKPLYEQIKDSLRERMLNGVWRAGDRLPSVRELAGTAAINPNTIQKAYRDLEAEGFVYSVAGKGCYVAETPPDILEKRKSELIEKAKPLFKELFIAGLSADEVSSLFRAVCERTEAV